LTLLLYHKDCHSRAGGNPGSTDTTNEWIPGSWPRYSLPENDNYETMIKKLEIP